MPSSQSDWDAKHRLAAEAPPAEPASIVRELLPLLPAGPALDIACRTQPTCHRSRFFERCSGRFGSSRTQHARPGAPQRESS
jgi:hypothetical protein